MEEREVAALLDAVLKSFSCTCVVERYVLMRRVISSLLSSTIRLALNGFVSALSSYTYMCVCVWQWNRAVFERRDHRRIHLFWIIYRVSCVLTHVDCLARKPGNVDFRPKWSEIFSGLCGVELEICVSILVSRNTKSRTGNNSKILAIMFGYLGFFH